MLLWVLLPGAPDCWQAAAAGARLGGEVVEEILTRRKPAAPQRYSISRTNLKIMPAVKQICKVLFVDAILFSK